MGSGWSDSKEEFAQSQKVLEKRLEELMNSWQLQGTKRRSKKGRGPKPGSLIYSVSNSALQSRQSSPINPNMKYKVRAHENAKKHDQASLY